MEIYNYYKATFPGEIKEKFKRKMLIKLNCFENFSKNYFLNVNINSEFLHKENIIDHLKINIKNKFNFFNKEVNLFNIVDWGILEKDKNIDWYRINVKDYKDIKYIWEMNRLQFLLPLVLSGNKKRALELLDSWIENNMYGKGPNWNSNLEVAIRSVSIINMLVAINENKFYEKYAKELYLHANHIYHDIYYTEKCIPNNHLVGEAASLYCLSKFINCKESKGWEEKSKEILKKYLCHIREDGTYLEGSLSYHRFYLQMYIMVYIFSKKTNSNFLEKEIENKLKKSLEFFYSIRKPNKKYPDFGDNDEGCFYKIDFEDTFDNFVNFLNSLFFTEKINYKIDEITLLEKIYSIKLERKPLKLNQKKYFEDGKFVAIKDEENYLFLNNQDQIYHSHSDGLSLELMLNKKNILIDSGTFNYNLSKEKRSYYRGSKSHNTVYLNEDQSLQIGSFRWINTAESKLYLKESEKKIIGEIKTKNNKIHKREIEFKDRFNRIEINDFIKNVKKFELNWHFDKEISLRKVDKNKYKILNTNYLISFELNFSEEIEIKKSFYSSKYGIEEKRINLKIKNLEQKEKYFIKTIIFKEEEI